jgi:hypothetical protein
MVMRLSLFLFVCAVLSSNALRAGTTIVYGNYDTGGPFVTTSGLSIGNADAVPFTDDLTAPLGFVYAVSDVDFLFATGDNNGDTGLSNNPVTVSLYGTKNGLPGTLLDSVTVNLDSSSVQAQVEFPDQPQLQTGQEYWLALSDPITNDLEWYTDNNPDSGIAVYDGSNWNYHDSFTQGAIQVDTALVVANSPEATTFMALGSGLIFILRKCR